MTDLTAARQHMIDGQLLPNRVYDEDLLEAMAEIQRELFVPKSLRSIAYIDEDIRVADDRYLMEPMVFARLVQEARIGPNDAVLDIGCGTGYSTAVLAKLSSAVVAVEEDEDLSKRASENLANAGIDNAAVVTHSLKDCLPEQAPYDVIMFEGAVPEVPDNILDQLSEGGRLLAVIRGETRGPGKATLFLKSRGIIGKRELFDANTPPLPGFEKEAGFVF
ncbi:MAG: protein-L-isoaspartate O-methyltransferase [Alphaproteobacteria bacterium]|nr:protein-L-isoaspartate O-methyltransferase [Alphaproteobacteria bacterium]